MALKLKGIELLSNQQVRTLDLTVAQREEEMEEAEEVPMKGTSASTAANTDIGKDHHQTTQEDYTSLSHFHESDSRSSARFM